MAIYVDDPMPLAGKFKNWCHMWSDKSIAELVGFAHQLGLKDSWLQYSRGLSGDFYHFDLSPAMRQRAIAQGAQRMDLRDWIRQRRKA